MHSVVKLIFEKRLTTIGLSLCNLHKSSFHSVNNNSRILGYSTIMLQDGLDIQELPVVIRRMDSREFPFTNVCYSGEGIRKISQHDLNFQNYLQNCKSTEEVLKLLEVPTEQVTAYSAAFALHRLCQLAAHSSIDENIDCFLHRAILRELCDTVCKDFFSLNNKTVSQLCNCFVQTKGIPEESIEAVYSEAQKRIADGVYSMSEMLYLLNFVSTAINQNSIDLMKVIWIHIMSSRQSEINEENIGNLWHLSQFLNDDMKYTLNILSKCTQLFWWKLNANDVCLICKTLLYQKYFSVTMLQSIGRWLINNMQNLRNDQFSHILATYDYFQLHDKNALKAIERILPSRISNMDRAIVRQSLNYLYDQRILLPAVMNAVSKDFAKNNEEYDHYDALACLRIFGFLNYMPANNSAFFLSVENYLHKKFNNFTAPSIIELLSSFTYIQVFPITFLKKIFAPLFIWRLQNVNDIRVQQKAYKNFLHLQAAVLVDLQQQKNINLIDRSNLGVSIGLISGRAFRIHVEIGDILKDLIPNLKYREAEMPKYTAHFIDYEINASENREIFKNENCSKIAIIVSMPEHYCRNHKHMLGAYSTKRRHLNALGYTVIEVNYEQMCWKNKQYNEKKKYLNCLLSDFLNLP